MEGLKPPFRLSRGDARQRGWTVARKDLGMRRRGDGFSRFASEAGYGNQPDSRKENQKQEKASRQTFQPSFLPMCHVAHIET